MNPSSNHGASLSVLSANPWPWLLAGYPHDRRRVALLLIGRCEGGDDRWYERNVPPADRLFAEHLKVLEREEGS